MKSKTDNSQNTIISEIRKLEVSLRKTEQGLRNEMKGVEQGLRREIKHVEKSLRGEIKKTERVLRAEILRVEEKVENLDDKTQAQHDKVMTSISNFSGRVETLEDENAIGTEQTRDHEVRIQKLESS